MDIQKIVEILCKVIDREASSTVGMLCKRVEVLQSNKSLSPNLFKELSKEIIYEQSRVLKKLIKFSFIPKVTFVTKTSKENNND